MFIIFLRIKVIGTNKNHYLYYSAFGLNLYQYLLLDKGNGFDKHEKQLEQAEDVNYFAENREYLRINYLNYLQTQAFKPVDELLKVALHLESFMENQLKLRIQKTNNILQKIKKLFAPRLNFKD